jgi:hypothetical protein
MEILKFQKLSSSDVVGLKFGYFTILKDIGTIKGSRRVLVSCVCGTQKEVFLSNIKRRSHNSCGCMRTVNQFVKHGLTKHPLYGIWNGIKVRCSNPNRNAQTVRNYFAKGIKMCAEWKNDFKVFYDWALKNGWEKGLEVDRIDGNGNYCPDNCRIATKKMQARNTKTNIFFTIDGERRCLSEWCEIYCMNYKVTHQRMKRDGHNLESLIKKYGKKP